MIGKRDLRYLRYWDTRNWKIEIAFMGLLEAKHNQEREVGKEGCSFAAVLRKVADDANYFVEVQPESEDWGN